MTQQEFLTIVATIKAAYPNSNVMPDKNSMNVWYAMLKDLDYKYVHIAVTDHISNNKFAPAIAEIREKCSILTSTPVRDWGEAWESVLMAIRKFGYMQEEEALESMDEITRKCVKRIGFNNICMSENITADRANFRMIYEQEATRQKASNQLPIGVREQKEEILNNLIETTTKKIEHKEEKREVKTADMDRVKKMLNELRRT